MFMGDLGYLTTRRYFACSLLLATEVDEGRSIVWSQGSLVMQEKQFAVDTRLCSLVSGDEEEIDTMFILKMSR